jgi:hypothetical protein
MPFYLQISCKESNQILRVVKVAAVGGILVPPEHAKKIGDSSFDSLFT